MTTSTSQPQWLTSMATTRAYMHLCLAANDFSYFDARLKLQQKQPVLYRQLFHQIVLQGPEIIPHLLGADPPPVQKFPELNGIVQNQLTSMQDHLNQGKAAIEDAANNAPKNNSDLPAWKKKLFDENEKQKADMVAQMDKGYNDAVEHIGTLPESQQGIAADAYTSAQDVAMGALHSVLNVFDQAWGKVTAAWNSAVEWVEGAIKSVEDIAKGAVNAIEDGISSVGHFFGF